MQRDYRLASGQLRHRCIRWNVGAYAFDRRFLGRSPARATRLIQGHSHHLFALRIEFQCHPAKEDVIVHHAVSSASLRTYGSKPNRMYSFNAGIRRVFVSTKAWV